MEQEERAAPDTGDNGCTLLLPGARYTAHDYKAPGVYYPMLVPGAYTYLGKGSLSVALTASLRVGTGGASLTRLRGLQHSLYRPGCWV